MTIDVLIEEANKIIDELAEKNAIDNLSEVAKLRLERLIRRAELLGFNEAYALLENKLNQGLKKNVVEK